MNKIEIVISLDEFHHSISDMFETLLFDNRNVKNPNEMESDDGFVITFTAEVTDDIAKAIKFLAKKDFVSGLTINGEKIKIFEIEE